MGQIKKTLGKVPVGRGTYSATETYYKENTVQMYGMSFRALTDMKGVAPASLNSFGKVTLVNTDKWELISGSVDTYNNAKDMQNLGNKVGTLEERIDKIKPVQIIGDVTNAADEEDLTTDGNLLKLKDRSNINGMGYVILRQNKTFKEQVTQPNTIYEIRYDFDLGGAEVEIPENCVLKFEGGVLRNGKLIYNNTLILGKYIDSIELEAFGSISNEDKYIDMYGCIDWSRTLERALTYTNALFFLNKEYTFSSAITIKGSNISMIGNKSVLTYIGVGDFISLGTLDDELRINIADFKVIGKSANRIFKFVNCKDSRFNNIDVWYGDEGFSWDTSNGIHLYSVFFNRCKSSCASLYGFNLVYQHTHQVNDITLLDCFAGGVAGEDSYKPQSSPNSDGADGVRIGGCGIRIIGGEFSGNIGCGIHIQGYCRGISVIGIYSERNSFASIYIDNRESDMLNVSVVNAFDYDNNIVNDYDSYIGLRKFNITVNNIEVTKNIPLFSHDENKTIKNVLLREAVLALSGTQIPCHIHVDTNDSVIGNGFTFTGMRIGDNIYNFINDCEYKRIVSKVNNTVTFDSQINDSYAYWCIFDKKNPLYGLYNVEELISLKVGVCLSDPIYYDYQQEYRIAATGISNTQGLETLTNSKFSDCEIGDYIYFFNSTRLRGNNTSIINGSVLRKDTYHSLPSNYSILPSSIIDNLCVMFYFAETSLSMTMSTMSVKHSPNPTNGESRPDAPIIGFYFFDESLGKPIWWNGTAWVDATGTQV